MLDEPAPALVSAPRGERQLEAIIAQARRRLHLHSHEPPVEIGDQIDIWAVAEREVDGGATPS
jgi:hypothetical protein